MKPQKAGRRGRRPTGLFNAYLSLEFVGRDRARKKQGPNPGPPPVFQLNMTCDEQAIFFLG